MDEAGERLQRPSDASWPKGASPETGSPEQPVFQEVDMGDFDSFEIEFLPQFREGRGPEKPFINEYGVLIGDHDYESPNSPLQQWSKHTDPMVMAGDQWVHPFKDIGFKTEENIDYFEEGIPPQVSNLGARFMHPDKDVAYEANLEHWDGEPQDPKDVMAPAADKEDVQDLP